MSLATSCNITQHHAIGSGSGSGAGGVRCHPTEGVAEERRAGGSGSGRQAGVRSGSGRRAGVGSLRGSPYNDYLDQFWDLIYNSSYTDQKTVVVKFRRGLNRQISMAFAGMTYGRPSDTDPEAWFRLAVRMDQNHVADEAFHVYH